MSENGTRSPDVTGAVEAQRAYYRATAERYDEMHGRAEHELALRHAIAYIQAIGARSVLDTGCGTGLALSELGRVLPELRTHGNDPSEAMLRVARDRHGLPGDKLDCADSANLPYEDGSFDVVIETGVLHHVPYPDRVISEMLRVARLGVFLSDDNCYGTGSRVNRLAKLGLARLGLLRRADGLRRGGHAWYSTEGDGVGWTYSVFDSVPLLEQACHSVIVIPTRRERWGDRIPLLFASHCFVAGFKEEALG